MSNKLKSLFDQQGGKCHYCGIETFLPPQQVRGVSYQQPDDLATIEHLYPVGHPKRKKRGSVKNTVMACRKCNQLKNKEFCIAKSKKEKLKKAS